MPHALAKGPTPRATKRAIIFALAFLGGLAAVGAARADDSALLNRATPPPNVLVILDTSQSMTWYNYTGSTRGDEYTGWTGDSTPTARMAMAKSVMSQVVTTFYDKLNLGLASYAENGTGSPPNVNPNADVRIKRYYYYCTDGGTYCTNPSGSRQYINFTPPWSSLASGGTTTVWNNLQLTVTSSNINMPSQNTFTINWVHDPAHASQPVMTGPFTGTTGGTSGHPDQWRCDWDVDDYEYNTDGTSKSGYNPKTTVNGYQGAWSTTSNTPCPAGVAQTTLAQTETYDKKVSGDDPYPYKYNLNQTWTSYNLYTPSPNCLTTCTDRGGPGPSPTYGYNTLQPQSSWTDYRKRYYNPRVEYSPAVASTPGTTYYYYTFTWYYKGLCTSGCSGYLPIFSKSVNSANQSAATPIPAAPAEPLTVPFTRVYTWSGNNYEIGPLPPAPANPENSCATSPFTGPGITVLVDVGGSPDGSALHNYLGDGTDKTKELHGGNYYTPLAAGLNTALKYFLNQDPYENGPVQTDPQKDCRRNFVILVTDGGESCPLVPLTGPGSPGSMAAALLSAPVNALGGVPTYVVGLDAGTLSADEQTVLRDIASKGSVGGSGTYYSASTPATLLAALNAVIGSILSQNYEFVSPWVPTLRTSDNLMLIQGSLTTPSVPPANPNIPWWQGALTAFPMDSSGDVTTASGEKITATPLWEAGAKLAATAATSRTIWTLPTTTPALNASLVAFSSTNAGVVSAMNVTVDVNADSVVNSSDVNQVIAVVRGPNPSNTASSTLYVGTNGYLGDIFHSAPVLVGPPNPTYADRTFDPANPATLLALGSAPDTYGAFQSAFNTRQRLVLVGANDGMLHAFNAGTFSGGAYSTGDGSEVWAFIPPQLLPNLVNLARNNGHQYYVDGSPRVADVWLDGDSNDGTSATADGVKTSNEWHTVLVGGFRQGGTGLYALDITNTTSPKFLWTFPTTGQSWSDPAFGKVKAQISGRLVDRWVVFVGDGYDSGGTNGKKVHAIDIQTGKDIWQYTTTAPVAAGPIVIDINNDGYADRVYVGTLGGDLLRLDVSAVGKSASGGDVNPAGGTMVATCASVPTSSSTCWYGSVFFSAGASQPFYTKVAATMDPANNLWIFAGSGDRSNPLLVPGTNNRSYGIKDAYPSMSSTLHESDLTDVTNVNGGVGSLDPTTITGSGWFFQFRSGEKEWAEVALVFNSQVFFTTFMPGSSGCGDVGSGTVYMVYYLTGGGVTDTLLFTSTPPQASSRIYQVNAGVTNRPVVTTGVQGTGATVYLGNSNGLLIKPQFDNPSSIRNVRFWRRVLP